MQEKYVTMIKWHRKKFSTHIFNIVGNETVGIKLQQDIQGRREGESRREGEIPWAENAQASPPEKLKSKIFYNKFFHSLKTNFPDAILIFSG